MTDQQSDEAWRHVVGFPGYMVSSLGRVRGKMVPILVPRNNPAGYACVWLSIGGVVTAKKIATLVCEAFHGARPPGLVCAHNDGDKTNNCASNLRWATTQENHDDMALHGTRVRHEKHPGHILTVQKVLEFKRRHKASLAGRSRAPCGFMDAMSQEYGVRKNTLGAILRGQKWPGINL